jgi:hypothetical protein
LCRECDVPRVAEREFAFHALTGATEAGFEPRRS